MEEIVQEQLLEIKHLEKSYGEDSPVLKDISLSVKKGEVVVLLGPSGCGKSTLLRTIMGLEHIQGGEILLEGKNIVGKSQEARKERQNLGMVFQSYDLFPHMNIMENLLLAPMKVQGRKREEAVQEARELLARVHLSDKENAYPSMLSGGQKQRVAIARALATKPEVLLCDEATSALDPKTTEQILELLKKINKEMGVTIIIITHQMSVIESICDEVAIIDHSKIAEDGPVKEIFRSPKTEIGKRLILGEGEKEAFFGSGRRFRIVFDGKNAHDPILSELILALHTPVNILFANTKEVDGMAVGQMVIELPENIEDILHVTEFMKERGIPFEEVHA